MQTVTCTAPVNIAVIKYWGKRDENLILPVNSSVSVTLNQAQLRAKTTITASGNFTENRLWLNGKEESTDTPRFQNLLAEIRKRASGCSQGDSHLGNVLSWNIHVCSENNFPTAAGLASSAAGYACLAYTLATLYGVEEDISDIARRGSGSACRSVHGGFVLWDKGERLDGSDSVARQLEPESHWPDLRVLILVVSEHKKMTGSTSGMQTTVRTSELLSQRVQCVEKHIQQIQAAIRDRDFQTFAEITMKDSNQLHAVCLDTYPPISYLTDVSRQIIQLIHSVNAFYGRNKVAYTFDAGPNACLFMLKEDVPRVTSLVNHFFPPGDIDEEFFTGLSITLPDLTQKEIDAIPLPIQRGAIKYIIHTKPGPGPEILDHPAESLLNSEGYPHQTPEPSSFISNKRKFDSLPGS